MDSQIYRGRKASRQDIFNAGSPPASSSEDSDIPGLSMTLNRSITHPDSGLGQRNQSPDQIDEDEWGSDGDDTGSEGGLSEDMGTDDSGTEQGSSSDDHEPAADASDADVLKRLPSRWKPEAEAPRRRGLLKRGGDGAADARESSPRDTSASEGEVSDGEGEDDSGNDTDDDGIDAGANRQGSIGMDEDDGENDMEGAAHHALIPLHLARHRLHTAQAQCQDCFSDVAWYCSPYAAVMEAHSLVLHQQLRAKVKIRRERCKGTGWAKLEADYATIQAAPTESKPQSGVAAQTAKAASVANQVKLWERALAVRITLQRGLVAADRLPRGAAYAQTLASAEGAAAKVDAAKREAAAVLGDCMDAVHALIARTVEGTAVPGAAGGGPGSQATERGAEPGACEAVWPLVEALEARFQGFRDEEVDRWHRRTLLASGQVAMRGAGLQALNQPLSRQVAEVLRNPDRALARTRRRRQEHDRVLCEPAAAPRVAPGHGDDASEGTGEDDVAVAQEGGRVELDDESYNDAAFYQLLLQEFLEAAETDGRVSGVAQVRIGRDGCTYVCCEGVQACLSCVGVITAPARRVYRALES